MYIYTVDFKNQFNNGWSIIIFICGAVGFPFYMVYRYGMADLQTFIFLSVIFLLVFLLPQLVVHINYFKINRTDIFYYDPDGKKIALEHKGVYYSFKFDDIEKIVRYMSYPLDEKRSQWFPWDSYNHSIIFLKDGTSFTITSLLVPNMDLPIEPVKVIIKKSFYRLVSEPSNPT